MTKEYITTIKYYSNSTSLEVNNNNSIKHENQNKTNKINKIEQKANLSNSDEKQKVTVKLGSNTQHLELKKLEITKIA